MTRPPRSASPTTSTGRPRTSTTSSSRTSAGDQVLLQDQRRGGHPVHRGRVVHHRAVRPREVPVLQLRRPGHPVMGPEHVGQHLARVLRQLLVRGHRDRGPGRRQGRAALPPAERRPVLRQPGLRQRPGGVAGLRQQHRPQRGQPAVDARARQPRGRVWHRHALRAPWWRARRHRRAGRRGELLERPVRIRSLPEPLPAAGQRQSSTGTATGSAGNSTPSRSAP